MGGQDMNLDKCPLTDEEKHKMIAEAAFLRSRQRAFPGDPVADWLMAEAELNDALATYCRSEHGERELPVYHRMRAEVRRILEKAVGTVNPETIGQVLAKVNADLRKTGEFLPESIDRASKAVKQEIEDVISRLGQNWDTLRIKQSELLAGWKDKGTQTWSRTAQSFHQWLARWRNKGNH
jgi:Protein of unknown function (DUF2934)